MEGIVRANKPTMEEELVVMELTEKFFFLLNLQIEIWKEERGIIKVELFNGIVFGMESKE